ncbi:interstitial collagenase A-like [Nannospalax galili]|uniref:Interstitial collagenase A-like n=1 Tax=Nannospalax galili TaxID=1026970 RepID=A0A8C6QYN4_NANGA|nr:interstitial collagenase A-like [Nannospalax galili]
MSSFPLLLLLLLLWGPGSYGFPALPEGNRQDVEKVWKFLENYYKLDEYLPTEKLKGTGLTIEKLKQIQQFLGLKVTGKSVPQSPGVGRNAEPEAADEVLYVTENNPRWQKTHLTYRLTNYETHLPREVVDRSIDRAFKLWSDVSPLTFSRIFEDEADIMITFFRGDHNDNNPFDGPGNLLAHAFQPGPGIGGDIHIDADETWTDNTDDYNLFYIMAHEVGHSLGLFHSSDIGALMYPSYSLYTEDYVMPQDDIDHIQALYGPSLNPIQPTGPQTPRPCDSSLTFDAVTSFRGELMFFKDRFYIRVNHFMPEVELNFIGILWPDLPRSELDAAYELSEKDEVRVFKGNEYWAVNGRNLVSGYPRDIYSSFGFPEYVTNIDAAVCEEEIGKTYFFVGDMYWRYDENKLVMDEGYPRLIAQDFPGIGQKVDAVFQRQRFFYFFHESNQYEFNLEAKEVHFSNITNSWFNC